MRADGETLQDAKMTGTNLQQKEWFAVTVRPQHEKTAAHAFRAKAIEEFLPLYCDRRRWSDRFRDVELPLFPGYVFCRIPPRARAAVLSTPGVRSIVGFGRTPAPVPEREIQSIRAMVSSGLPVAPWPFLKTGQAVLIERGPLSGLEGTLLQLKDAWRVVVSVPLLQRAVAVEVDRDVISVVKPLWPGGRAVARSTQSAPSVSLARRTSVA